MANNTQLTDSHGNPITPQVPMPAMTASNVSTTGGSNVQTDLNNINQRINNLDPSSGSIGGSSIPLIAKPLFHHLNQERELQLIPAESLLDIRYAKDLGFETVELNPQRCSDGVYVVKHGSSGKLGAGLIAVGGADVSQVQFADVTSTWLRENVKHNSAFEKYQVPIPTLDEAMACVKEWNLSVKMGNGVDDEVLTIARKYITDDKICFYMRATRGAFRGTMTYIYDPTTTSVDAGIAAALNMGLPCVMDISPGLFKTTSDEVIRELCAKAHANGLIVGMSYPSGADVIRALSLGIDSICSTSKDINPFSVGIDLNINKLTDSNLVLSDGATYDSATDTIIMPVGAKVTVSEVNGYSIGMVSSGLRYDGVLTFANLTDYQSDGNRYVEQHFVFDYPHPTAKRYTILGITATAATTLYNISLKFTKLI